VEGSRETFPTSVPPRGGTKRKLETWKNGEPRPASPIVEMRIGSPFSLPENELDAGGQLLRSPSLLSRFAAADPQFTEVFRDLVHFFQGVERRFAVFKGGPPGCLSLPASQKGWRKSRRRRKRKKETWLPPNHDYPEGDWSVDGQGHPPQGEARSTVSVADKWRKQPRAPQANFLDSVMLLRDTYNCTSLSQIL